MASSKIRMCLVSWWAICGLAGTGCDSLLGKEPNPAYCASPPCSPPDSNCTANTDCTTPGTSVCDVTAKQCVQCTASDHAACSGTAPVCGADNACRACAAHSECASDACSFADGSCVAETDVAYADSASGTNNTTCDRATPCTSLVAALATGRHFVRFRGMIDEAVVLGDGRVATILADSGATLTHSGDDAVLTVTGNGTSLTVYDLTISGNTMAGGGVVVPKTGGAPTLSLINTTITNHAAQGISVEAGAFTLARSAISRNLGGGVVIDGSATFFMVGNTFFLNGGLTSTTGAVRITAKQSQLNRLDFNSFFNNAKQGTGGAVSCDAGIMFTASNNIIYNPALVADPTTGSCTYAYSLIQPGTVPPNAHNLSGDPEFVDTTMGDLHLLPGSPAFQAADPAADVSGLALHDIDGKPRTPPPATLGAYQMQ